MGYVRTSAKKRAKIPRSLDVQPVPAGGVEFSQSLNFEEAKLKSIGGGLGETFASMSQVYRQRVTNLEENKRIGFQDEKEQRRECKAEFPALTVAAAALPR